MRGKVPFGYKKEWLAWRAGVRLCCGELGGPSRLWFSLVDGGWANGMRGGGAGWAGPVSNEPIRGRPATSSRVASFRGEPRTGQPGGR